MPACRVRLQQGRNGRAGGVEALAYRPAGEVAGVDAFRDDGQLQVAQRLIEREGRDVPAGAFGVPRGELQAGREAGVGGRGVAHPEHRLTDRIPVDEHQPEVGERVPERGHFPVHDRADRAGIVAVQDGVVEPVVAVHDRGAALHWRRLGQQAVQLVQRGQLPGGDPPPLAVPAPYLPFQVAVRAAEVAEAHLIGIDRVQPD